MYKREVENVPEAFVVDGKPVFGTFRGHSRKFDIRGVYRPYGTLPMPTFITNLRIKSRLSFFFNLGEYIGSIEFFDAKIFGMAEVIFWNKKTAQKYVYHSYMGPRKRFVPHNLENAITYCNLRRRYIRIGWNRKNDNLSVVFNLHASRTSHGCNGALLAKFSDSNMGECMTISPSPTKRRCAGYYYLTLGLHGAITVLEKNGKEITMEDTEGQAFVAINRSYLKFRSHGQSVTCFGEVNNQPISFRISSTSQEAVEPEKYNSNVLFYGGKLTALPPVVITHPFGVENKWVIQDTENMVDLTFVPVSQEHKAINALVLTTEYHTIMGTFEGFLVNGDGERINIKSLVGMAKTYLLRL